MSTNTCTAPAAPTLQTRPVAAPSRAWLAALSRNLGAFRAWLQESFEAAGAIDARLRERRDDDAARLARSGASPTRVF